MTLLTACFTLALSTPAAAQEADRTERGAQAAESHPQALEPSMEEAIAAGGIDALIDDALSQGVELAPVEVIDGDGPGTIQAATLHVCTQYGGVNVAPGELYCEYEWVDATCEELGYVSGMPNQSSDGVWIWGCGDDPAGTPI